MYNNRIKRRHKLLVSFIVSVFFAANVSGQLNNKPTTVTQVPAPTGTVATVPAAYPSGMKVNYVRTWEATAPWTNSSTFNTQNYTEVKQTTTYVDGLGRPLQTVLKQATSESTPRDMVSPFIYDEFGREQYKYMPYISATSTGNFKADPFNEQSSFLQNQYSGEQVFYGKTNFESSPLNRPIKSFAPGNSWAGSNVGTEQQFLINTSADAVRIWSIGNDANFDNNIPTSSSVYPAGELFVNKSIDEQGNAVIEYKDKEGKVILKKVQLEASPGSDHTGWLCTYYIYDDFNLLRFVISPKAVKWLSQNSWNFAASEGSQNVNELSFRYQYDNQNRMIAKKVPGAGWVYMVYDKRDRLVFTQDANMRSNNQWLSTLYDVLNRPVLTGMITYTGSRTDLQDYVEANTGNSQPTSVNVTGTTPPGVGKDIIVNSLQTNLKDYQASNSISLDPGFDSDNSTDLTAEIVSASTGSINENIEVLDNPLPPGSNFIALTINYYDNYNWTNKTYNPSDNGKLDAGNNLHAESMPTTAEQQNVQTRGIQSGGRVRTIPNPSSLATGDWLTAVNFFDDRGRVIQINSEGYKGSNDIVTNRYDFTGKVLSAYMVHTNPQDASATTRTIRTKTNMEYDHMGRLMEVWKTFNDDAASKKIISKNYYDAMGQLIKKELGKNAGTNLPLETLDYSYNIRGWLKGINKDYSNNVNGAATRWFGMELNYDWGFNNNQLNGNIGGIKWRGRGDGEQRAYGFGYDRLNRLLFSDFNQYTSGNWDKTAGVDFTSIMGNGTDVTTAYDENGNIKAMKQWGFKLTNSAVIDELNYTYFDNTNKLKNVLDGANDATTKLGDFKVSQKYLTDLGGTKNNSATDYAYDDNGNLKKDLNKDIGNASVDGIEYNHLNLPWEITVKTANGNKGTITYVYDAAGNKLEKITNELANGTSPETTKKTTYLGGYIYENNELKFFGHEEGRTRWSIVNSQLVFNNDYFVKDHLGNVRVMLTDEQQTDAYPVASLETGTLASEKLYYNIPDDAGTRVNKNSVTDYPTDNYTSPNDFIHKLNGNGTKIGSSIVLKVMAGDKFSLRVNSWYKTNNATPDAPNSILNDLINSLTGGVGSITSTHSLATVTELTNSGALTSGATSFFNSQTYVSSKPKASINWILLDERFNFVGSSSGFEQVGNNEEFKLHTRTDLPIDKSGYLYIYVSNETPNINVFFDNLQVTHVRGPLTEENTYYPFGLVMTGISSKAAGGLENNKKYIGNELQHNEFTDGSGLDFYDFNARTYDQQLGRFIQIDPLNEEQDQESWSPYHYSFNNPIIFSDPDGELPIIPYAAYRVVRALIYLASPKGNGLPIRFYLKQAINDNTTIVATLPLLMPKKVVAPDKTEDGGFFSRKLKSVSKEVKTETNVEEQQYGGGKNAQHVNQKAREVAKEKYEKAREEYQKLRSQPNKTKEDKIALDKAERAMKREKQKMDNVGENHSRKAKGSN